MGLTKADIERLAGLARIELTDDEASALAPQLDVILEAVARVQEVATDDVPLTSHALPLRNVFREDVIAPSLTAQQALSGAPDQEDGRFRVPQILGEQ